MKPKNKKEALLSQGTKGDTNKSFRDRIVKIYGNLPRATQSYSLPTGNSGSIKLDDSKKGESDYTDLEIFSRLYNPGQLAQTTGNGELSLWWLFNCSNDVYDKVNSEGGFSPICKVNQGGDDQADPDLKIGISDSSAIYMEVKSLPKGAWSKTNSLGRFGRFTDFIDLVGLLQSFENSFGENNLPGGVKTLKNISYSSLVDSAEVFCEVRNVVKKNNLEKYKYFTNLNDKFDNFDKICDKHEILRKCRYNKTGGFRPGGEEIAKRLLGFVAITAFKEKPGYGNWMVNVPSEGGLQYVECFKPLETNFNLDKIKVSANFKIDNGSIKLKFLEMFS